MNIDNWQNADNELVGKLNYKVAEWLLEYGSLTEKLKRNGLIEIEVLNQELTDLTKSEKKLIESSDKQLITREVVLSVEGRPWVFARTVLNQASEGLIQSLGNKPLGSILFSDQNLQRQFLKIRKLNKQSNLLQRIPDNLADSKNEKLWARRSLWESKAKSNDNARMLVTEVFLPDSPLYQK